MCAMLKIVLISLAACSALAAPLAPELDADWNEWKAEFGKVYTAEMEIIRRLVWEDNLKKVAHHNLEHSLGKQTFTLGMNQFADLTTEEFKAQMNGFKQSQPGYGRQCSSFLPSENFELPPEVDWRTKGYVTPVKDQRQCGSCWAFSATGSLEGQHFKKTGKLVSLSEENLVDCSLREGNLGCLGGLMNNAFLYIKRNNGIDTEVCYPYKGHKRRCLYVSSCKGATCTGCMDVLPHMNETALKVAVATVGPVAVAMDAGHQSFQMYKSGIYHEPNCSSTQLDHGVLAVGYGTLNGKDYWLVKNSWGPKWGMKGYFMIERNHNNECGLATQASYPLV